MTVWRTIAELAQDKKILTECLAEIDHEISRRAGEVDPPDDDDQTDPDRPIETAVDQATTQRRKDSK